MYQSHPNELEDIEIQLLLEGIYRYYGFDFRNYAMASLKRRILNIVRSENLNNVSSLQEKILHDRKCFESFLLALTVNVTTMFRDPSFYVSFRNKVIPLLRTYPFIRIWHAGCSTGEEVYSMAILLTEEGLYHRCRIYATDINEEVVHKAKIGIYPLRSMQEYTKLYQLAGGKKAFSEYYTADYNSATFVPSLKANIVFSVHNLVTDSSFNEFNVILCRNVLIYFNYHLQNQVHNLLYKSLRIFGILGLGKQESLLGITHEHKYEVLDKQNKLFRRVAS
ncbi:MAG: protein-glutamate O-methyltransferase CheR [Calothrix sp. C42_A2020_038]|nr:protein-glutamate O-methyltransferase CheR [Calothrix sp. C42_A2020_038]